MQRKKYTLTRNFEVAVKTKAHLLWFPYWHEETERIAMCPCPSHSLNPLCSWWNIGHPLVPDPILTLHVTLY